MIEDGLRIAIWNAVKAEGGSDALAYRIIGASTAAFMKSRPIAALGVILQADLEAPRFGLRYGLADCIDNDGSPYQSASLAAALQLLRYDFPPKAGAPAAADAPTPAPTPLPEGAAPSDTSQADIGEPT
jgi:hypothetical protein